MTGEIRRVHATSRGTYGAPRIQAELAATGTAGESQAGRTVDAWGRRAGRQSAQAGRHDAAGGFPASGAGSSAAGLYGRRARIACGWPISPTSRPWRAGCIWRWCWMCGVGRVVGWAMATHLRTTLVLAALDMAIVQRQPQAVIHHSDQGERSTRRSPSAPGAAQRTCAHRWGRSAIASITRWPRASSRRSNASCSTGTSFPTPAAAQPAVFEFIGRVVQHAAATFGTRLRRAAGV